MHFFGHVERIPFLGEKEKGAAAAERVPVPLQEDDLAMSRYSQCVSGPSVAGSLPCIYSTRAPSFFVSLCLERPYQHRRDISVPVLIVFKGIALVFFFSLIGASLAKKKKLYNESNLGLTSRNHSTGARPHDLLPRVRLLSHPSSEHRRSRQPPCHTSHTLHFPAHLLSRRRLPASAYL